MGAEVDRVSGGRGRCAIEWELDLFSGGKRMKLFLFGVNFRGVELN